MKDNTMDYKWIALTKPLAYPVWDNDAGKIAIPKGATGVEFAPKQSSKTYKDKKTGETIHQNVYRWNGMIYNA